MYAKIAVINFTPFQWEWKRSIVQTLAKVLREEKTELMLKCEYALYAERNFMSINTLVQKPVQGGAELCFVGVKSIKSCGKQPVYNMEVDKYHNFSVNDGIIVHNCMDSMRYYAFTVLKYKVGKEPYIPLYERGFIGDNVSRIASSYW